MNTLIVFITDIGFLIPSLVAARQLIKQGTVELADLVIYTVNIDQAVIKDLISNPANGSIKFIALPYALFAPPEGITFLKNHVPVTSLARLALQKVIDPRYENIIYIDGDVQIVGDISDLVKYRVPDGKILAGRGSAWLDESGARNNVTPDHYLKNLGDIAVNDYFNAGVLAFRLDTWKEAAPRALQFFFDNSAACLRHDQSALNAIFKNNVIHFAPKYNFHSMYAELYVQHTYSPAIIHFTGPKKPWGLASPPWGNRFKNSYNSLIYEQPYLFGFLDIRNDTTVRHLCRSGKLWLKEILNLFKNRKSIGQRRRKFFSYIKSAEFPF